MATEDFTTFTEVDVPGYISVDDANTITVTSMIRNCSCWVQKSYGADHFDPDDFEHLVDYNGDAGPDDGSVCGLWGISNGQFTMADMDSNNDGLSVYYGDNSRVVTLRRDDGGGSEDATGSGYDGQHYLKIKGDSNTGYCYVYSDASRTTLEDTLTRDITAVGTKEYCFTAWSRESTNRANNAVTCTIENLDLQEAAGWGGEYCGVSVDEFDGVTPDEIDGV